MSGEFFHAELEITTICDMHCHSCDRFLDISHGPNLTLGQIAFFLRESVELDWPWKRFHVLGGEPTLHPQFQEVIDLLCAYRKNHRPDLLLRVISNGSGRLERYRPFLKDRNVLVNVESKSRENDPAWFSNMRLAPKDEGFDASLPCALFGAEACGIGVTPHGLYLCGAGAGINRMTGLVKPVLSLRDLTYAAMLEQAAALCPVCGHWDNHKRADSGVRQSRGKTSPFWEEALKRYKANRPALPIYGEGK